MPAQATLDDTQIAAVLNHVAVRIAKSGPATRMFTPSEIAKARSSAGALNPADVAKLHASVSQ
jgi:hypothetical protein